MASKYLLINHYPIMKGQMKGIQSVVTKDDKNFPDK